MGKKKGRAEERGGGAPGAKREEGVGERGAKQV